MAALCVTLNGLVHWVQEEIVSCEKQLEELSNVAVTSWIDAEWAASFFELKFEVPQELAVRWPY